MRNLAFYQKYRPAKFCEVLGQDHIIKVLSGAVEQDRISHAYLFSGPRGTGKTSMARILAREIGTSEKDIYELDAASNTSVEDIREIVEGARVLPFDSEKKVYIIDEAHMLSKSAFNAFLKTLEEPPAHVVFVLATTEAQKLPVTVVSRCQSFSFKKPTNEILRKAILNIVKKEGFQIDKESVNLITILGDGSFRDAIGILDQVTNCSKDKKITIDEVEAVTGAPRSSLVHSLSEAILDKNLDKALSLVEEAVAGCVDMKIFVRLLLRDLRNILFLKLVPDMNKEILAELSDDEGKIFERLKSHQNVKILPDALREMILVFNDIAGAGMPELPIELALIRLLGQQQRINS